jgi:hypothetical protein
LDGKVRSLPIECGIIRGSTHVGIRSYWQLLDLTENFSRDTHFSLFFLLSVTKKIGTRWLGRIMAVVISCIGRFMVGVNSCIVRFVAVVNSCIGSCSVSMHLATNIGMPVL